MAKKRSNSEGSIYYSDAHGRWEASIVTGRNEAGRLVRKTFTGRTRKAVAAKLDEAIAATDQGMPIPDSTTTLAEFATWWADEVLPTEGLAASTEQWTRDVLANYVVPIVGSRSLTGPRAIGPADVEAMCGRIMSEGKSHRTAMAARTTLGKMLRAAQSRGLVARNVVYISKRPRDRGKARPVKAFTTSEVAELLDAVDGTRWYAPVVVGVTTGLRPGELLALHWADVRLDRDPHLSVRLSLSHVDGATLKAPKRDRSYRTVPLAPEAVTALKAWRKDQAAEQLAAGPFWSTEWGDLVFTREDGEPRRVDTFRHALRHAMPGAHPHRLRHTYATHLLEAGTPIHHVAELLGDSVATVEATYSHVLRPKHEVTSVVSGLVART